MCFIHNKKRTISLCAVLAIPAVATSALLLLSKQESGVRIVDDKAFEEAKGVRCLAYAKLEDQLLVGYKDGTLAKYRMYDMSCIAIERSHNNSQVFSISTCNETRNVGCYVSCGSDNRIVLHREGQETVFDNRYEASVQISADDAYCIAAGISASEIAAVWTLQDLKKVQTIPLDVPSDSNGCLAVSPTKNIFAVSGFRNRALILWDIATASVIRERACEHVTQVAFNQKGDKLFILDNNFTFYVCDLALNVLRRLEIGGSAAFCVTADDRWLFAGYAIGAAAGLPGRIQVWDLAAGKLVRERTVSDHQITSMILVNGRTIVTGSLSGKHGLKRWSVDELIKGP